MAFVWKRLLGTIPSLVGVVVLTFFISHALPGDPAAYFAGPAANAASIANIRTTLGLDRPLPVQFVHYVGDLVQGNLGRSLTTGQPVLTDLHRTAACFAGIVVLRAPVRDQHRHPDGRVGRDPHQRTGRSCLPRAGHRQRRFPDLLRRPAVRLRLLFPARLGAAAARPAQRDRLLAATARHRGLYHRRPHRRRLAGAPRRHWPN